MKEKVQAPELRFDGFTDDWEERKLKDIAQFNPKTVLPDEFEYVDLESVVGTEMISHRTESKDQAPSRAQRLAQKGDVFYQTVRPYQMNNYLYDLPYDNYVFSTGYAQMRPNIDSYFLLNSVQNKQFVQHVLDRSTGTSYPAINSSDLSNIEIHVPSKLSEQQKIGAFFQSIDDTIALHQRKLDLFKEQKKGYLQKMFPKNGEKVPELRFAGFADDWEERKLGDIAPLRGGFAFKSSKFRNTGVPIVRISNILSSGEVGGDFAYYDEQDKDDKYILPDKSAVLAMSGATTGKVSILSQTDYDKVYQNQRVGYFQSVDYIDYGFISTIVRSELFMMQLESVLVSGAQPNVSSKEIDSFNFMIPILVQEQQIIGSFFKQLDETIALHQRKLDLLKEQKKGFLQKMFV